MGVFYSFWSQSKLKFVCTPKRTTKKVEHLYSGTPKKVIITVYLNV